MQARYYDPVIGRFYSNDPLGFRGVHSFNRYTYANNNPYKYIDPDGKDSFLVSRPLSFTNKANHNFIVHDAKYLGDPNATVRSFGDTGDGNMGEVNSSTPGNSSTTKKTDTDAWQSLSAEGSSATSRQIDAPDAKVAELADSIKGGQDYDLVPELQDGVNSNSAAGAIANQADGGFTFVNNGTSQPGSTVTERVEFKDDK
jgi:uncharacterized protein RhaS with RHS repeats